MKKIFVLDTNVLLYDPQAILKFRDNDICLHVAVLEELDSFKTQQSEIGRNAREVLKSIESLRGNGSFQSGIELGDKLGKLYIHIENIEFNFVGLNKSTDNILLGYARRLGQTMSPFPVVLVTKDINLRLKADVFAIPCQDYINDCADAAGIGKVQVVQTDGDELQELYAAGKIPIDSCLRDFKENECYIFQAGNQSALARVINGELVLIKDGPRPCGVKPRNAEQKFLVNMLMDKSIDMVVCAGVAGSGKTLLSLACGVEQATGETFDKVLITKAIYPVGQDIGYVKGDKNEKMAEWLKPFYDNLDFISREKTAKDYDELVEVDALTYIRGRSLMHRFVIIDEIQNLSPKIIKTIVTRIADTSKLVLLGDLQQFDNPYMDERNNGLAYVMARMQGHRNVGVFNMSKSERGRLATLAIESL